MWTGLIQKKVLYNIIFEKNTYRSGEENEQKLKELSEYDNLIKALDEDDVGISLIYNEKFCFYIICYFIFGIVL